MARAPIGGSPADRLTPFTSETGKAASQKPKSLAARAKWRGKKYRKVFREGVGDVAAEEAGTVAACMVQSFIQMFEQVSKEGLVLRVPKCSIHGEPIIIDGVRVEEVRAHPLIEQMVKVARSLGIDFNEFNLTPKSKKKSGDPQVKGNVTNTSNYDVKVLVLQHQEQIAQFNERVQTAKEMREKDPIYRKFATPEEEASVKELERMLAGVAPTKEIK